MRCKFLLISVVVSVCLFINNIQAQTKPTKTYKPSTSSNSVETQKNLFDKFFLLSDGDSLQMKEKLVLAGRIIKKDSTSKYSDFVIYWARVIGRKFNGLDFDIDALIEKNPLFAEAYYLRGQYFSYAEQSGSVEQMQKCIELNPKLAPPYYFLAEQAADAKNYKLSLTYYNLLEKADPKHPSVYYNRAQVKTSLQDYKGAIADYTKALVIKPRDYRIYFNRALNYSEEKDYVAAENDLSSFIKIRADYALAWYYRGICKYNQNKMVEACEDVKRAAQIGYPDADDFLAQYCK